MSVKKDRKYLIDIEEIKTDTSELYRKVILEKSYINEINRMYSAGVIDKDTFDKLLSISQYLEAMLIASSEEAVDLLDVVNIISVVPHTNDSSEIVEDIKIIIKFIGLIAYVAISLHGIKEYVDLNITTYDVYNNILKIHVKIITMILAFNPNTGEKEHLENTLNSINEMLTLNVKDDITVTMQRLYYDSILYL